MKVFETTSKQRLEVGVWFVIDRTVIRESQEEIRRKCNEAGAEGETLWERIQEAIKIADENPDQYPNRIKTYIFERNWEYKTEAEMRRMCKEIGNGPCDEVICNLELAMRICNGEPVENLVKKPDELPYVRLIEFRNGDTGYFGGGSADEYNDFPPADISRFKYSEKNEDTMGTPYAFCREQS